MGYECPRGNGPEHKQQRELKSPDERIIIFDIEDVFLAQPFKELTEGP
jgi:hypothetical protein